MTFEQIMRELKGGVYHPVYFLCGEEPYFIDRITDYIAAHALEDHEREFNQTVMYGRDAEPAKIIEAAKRYPMMAERQVVIVKEAQQMRKLETLQPYVENPLDSTILVLAHKYKKPDKRKAFTKVLTKHSVYLESNKLYENKVPDWIQQHLQEKGLRIEPRAALLLTEHLGSDLSRIGNELEKLALVVPEGEHIAADHIARHIGISKEFNTFELQAAIGKRDTAKANLIVSHFARNPKAHPLVVTVSSLYSYFSKLLSFHFLKDRSPQKVASTLRVHPFFVREYEQAARNFPATKVVAIIGMLRDYDLRSKGVNNASATDGELLKELLYRILH